MIYVDTRSAKTHRILRYVGLTLKTLIMIASFILAYFVLKYGV